MYRLPRAVLTQILAVRRKKEQGLPVDDGTEGWMLELVELMDMRVRHSGLALARSLASSSRPFPFQRQLYMHSRTKAARASLASDGLLSVGFPPWDA